MSNLTQRVFLMRNVHEDAPVLMKTRWALSFLRGPLTGSEIARAMADARRALDGSSSGRAGQRATAGGEGRPTAGGRRNRRVFPDRFAGQRPHSLQTHDRRLRQAASRRCEAGTGCLGNFRMAGAPETTAAAMPPWEDGEQRFATEGSALTNAPGKARNSPIPPAAHCAPPVIPAGQKPCRRVSTRPRRARACPWYARASSWRRSQARSEGDFRARLALTVRKNATPRWRSCAGSFGRPNYCSSPTRSGVPKTGMRASRRSSRSRRCRPR